MDAVRDRVPEVNLTLWVIKIAATTLGETSATRLSAIFSTSRRTMAG